MTQNDFYTFSSFFDSNLLSRKVYHRPFSELSSVKIIHLDDGRVKVFANVIGHKKEDIDVKLIQAERPGKWYLNIFAETEREHLGKYTTDYQIPVYNKLKGDIEGVVENGLLELTLEWDKSADPDFKVTIK
jgi:HSP20 family molecular chaperone IbpA